MRHADETAKPLTKPASRIAIDYDHYRRVAAMERSEAQRAMLKRAFRAIGGLFRGCGRMLAAALRDAAPRRIRSA